MAYSGNTLSDWLSKPTGPTAEEYIGMNLNPNTFTPLYPSSGGNLNSLIQNPAGLSPLNQNTQTTQGYNPQPTSMSQNTLTPSKTPTPTSQSGGGTDWTSILGALGGVGGQALLNTYGGDLRNLLGLSNTLDMSQYSGGNFGSPLAGGQLGSVGGMDVGSIAGLLKGVLGGVLGGGGPDAFPTGQLLSAILPSPMSLFNIVPTGQGSPSDAPSWFNYTIGAIPFIGDILGNLIFGGAEPDPLPQDVQSSLSMDAVRQRIQEQLVSKYGSTIQFSPEEISQYYLTPEGGGRNAGWTWADVANPLLTSPAGAISNWDMRKLPATYTQAQMDLASYSPPFYDSEYGWGTAGGKGWLPEIQNMIDQKLAEAGGIPKYLDQVTGKEDYNAAIQAEAAKYGVDLTKPLTSPTMSYAPDPFSGSSMEVPGEVYTPEVQKLLDAVFGQYSNYYKPPGALPYETSRDDATGWDWVGDIVGGPSYQDPNVPWWQNPPITPFMTMTGQDYKLDPTELNATSVGGYWSFMTPQEKAWYVNQYLPIMQAKALGPDYGNAQ